MSRGRGQTESMDFPQLQHLQNSYFTNRELDFVQHSISLHYTSTANYSLLGRCCRSNSDSAVNDIFGCYENSFNFILELLRISQH